MNRVLMYLAPPEARRVPPHVAKSREARRVRAALLAAMGDCCPVVLSHSRPWIVKADGNAWVSAAANDWCTVSAEGGVAAAAEEMAGDIRAMASRLLDAADRLDALAAREGGAA